MAADSADDQTSDNVDNQNRIRLAVVDDHSVTAEGLARIFSQEPDIELVGTASSVTGALDLVSATTPDVVLMDYRLPDGNGVDAAATILERWPLTNILILSGVEDRDILSRAVEIGCVGMLSKDRPWTDVVTAVRSAARGESVIRVEDLGGLLKRLRFHGAENQWLTARELEILGLLAQAKSTEDIAREKFLSTHTVRNHVSSILNKLGAHSRLEAVTIAQREGLLHDDLN